MGCNLGHKQSLAAISIMLLTICRYLGPFHENIMFMISVNSTRRLEVRSGTVASQHLFFTIFAFGLVPLSSLSFSYPTVLPLFPLTILASPPSLPLTPLSRIHRRSQAHNNDRRNKVEQIFFSASVLVLLFWVSIYVGSITEILHASQKSYVSCLSLLLFSSCVLSSLTPTRSLILWLERKSPLEPESLLSKE